ncbi:uncharacterized protein LOC142521907 [Primulina tabacum]|uniref:uncharacterized protein LOC142521907 n=1 Tax=Primulina tabacum TaxID=48773 RepID=UPI003F597064
MTYSMLLYVELYIQEIVRLHRIPLSIVYDRDPRFTSSFWKSLHSAMVTKLLFNIAFHPQTDGQSERVIQIFEDLLRACVIEFQDKKRRDLDFSDGDHVFVKIDPMKGVMLFGKNDKLSPRFIAPFEILESVGALSYKVALLPNLAGVHNVFHISMLWKYMSNSSHVMNYEALQLTPNLNYEEKPTQILGRKERRL